VVFALARKWQWCSATELILYSAGGGSFGIPDDVPHVSLIKSREVCSMDRSDPHNAHPKSVLSSRVQLCPSCGSFVQYAERVSFCILCGARLLNDCPQCHEHIVFPTGKFCPSCGAALVLGKD
jgi:predicted amidophosphoribosyltransferase